MDSYFSEHSIQYLEDLYEQVMHKRQNFLHRAYTRKYNSEKGKEYAIHGLLRRIDFLKHALDFTFSCIDPALTEAPSDENRNNATMAIQSFYMHVFGTLDNIAWIWVEEKPVTDEQDRKIKGKDVILFPKRKNKRLFESLPQKMQSLVQSHCDWYEGLLSFRDGLAHRIPLYIPPGVLSSERSEEFQILEDEKWRMKLSDNREEVAKIEAIQNEMIVWRPWMQHSFSENVDPILFHPQMLKDMNNILDLGMSLYDGLDAMEP